MSPTLGSRPPSISGSLRLAERLSGPVWYAALRLPDQEQRRLGPAAMVRKARSSPPRPGEPTYRVRWRARPGPAPAGHLSEREAHAQLEEILVDARRRQRRGPAAPTPSVTFAVAAEEWLRYVEHERESLRRSTAMASSTRIAWTSVIG